MSDDVNSVQYILKNYPLPRDSKLLIKNKGRPTPYLNISYTTSCKTRNYNRVFSKDVYSKYEWICGCPVRNKLFCFVCVIFKKDTTSWTSQGVDDLKHLAERAKKHEDSINHISACMDFNVLGKTDIQEQLSSVYLQNKLKHNENVEKNRDVLRKLITCIKFGAFEFALHSRDVITSQDRSIYVGLINLAADLDSVLAVHMKDAVTFKDDPKTIQNELLDAMLQVYKNELVNQLNSARFIALGVDETTDSSDHKQMVIIIRYVYDQKICERFWSFVKLGARTADHLASVILAELQHIQLPSAEFKLIAQSYGGLSVTSDNNNGVQDIIRKMFPYAYFVHHYAHEFDLIMEQAASCHRKIKIFFANLQSFDIFFSRSPKRVTVLDEIVKQRLPHAVPTRWNFKNRTANTLCDHIDSFRECLETIINKDEIDSKTINEACGLLNHLKCPEFLYWLKLFSFIMPHVEIFFNEVQSPGVDILQLKCATEQFEQQIIRVRSITESIIVKLELDDEEPYEKRQKISSDSDTRSVMAKEVCDNILTQIKDRFDFKGHLSASALLDSKNFKNYRQIFPQQYFSETIEAYPMLNDTKLKNELNAVYSRDDMCETGILPLLAFIGDNDLTNVLSETHKLLDIICTTPMSTSEREMCFSTLKRAKTFLKSTVTGDRLNAFAMLSIEKKFVDSIPDFHNKVIEIFCESKVSGMDFIYK